MVSIAPQSSDPGWVTDDPSWLGSAHGTDSTETGTVDTSLFTEATHYPNGYLPSGLPLGQVTTTGLYGPFDPDATDGREDLTGHLAAARSVTSADQRIAVGILTHGRVIVENLPVPFDPADAPDVAGRIRYV